MFFRNKPKSYYGIFSFFFKSKLYVLFFIYLIVIALISLAFSFSYELVYAGPAESCPNRIYWFHNLYYSLVTFISPGFTEFMPANDYSRIMSSFNGVVGLSFNALFLSILVARALQPHEPFEIVPFILYDPVLKRLTARFYSTLPANCYNLSFKLFRFVVYEDSLGRQIGRTSEMIVAPNYRNVLLPNYGILVHADIDMQENAQHSSFKRTHQRKKIPIEWLLPSHKKCPDGHFYLTVEAETPYGKMFQTQNYYLNKNDIKIGRHTLLNEGVKLTLDNWYKWKDYRWDLWGKFTEIPEEQIPKEDPIIRSYK